MSNILLENGFLAVKKLMIIDEKNVVLLNFYY